MHDGRRVRGTLTQVAPPWLLLLLLELGVLLFTWIVNYSLPAAGIESLRITSAMQMQRESCHAQSRGSCGDGPAAGVEFAESHGARNIE